MRSDEERCEAMRSNEELEQQRVHNIVRTVVISMRLAMLFTSSRMDQSLRSHQRSDYSLINRYRIHTAGSSQLHISYMVHHNYIHLIHVTSQLHGTSQLHVYTPHTWNTHLIHGTSQLHTSSTRYIYISYMEHHNTRIIHGTSQLHIFDTWNTTD